MATLDYAVLAEFARSEPTGAVSMLGASFEQLEVQALPAQASLAIVGRVLTEGDQPAALRVSAGSASGTQGFQVTFHTEVTPKRPRVEGLAPSVTFVVSTVLPIVVEGLYQVTVTVDGDEPYVMAFRAVVAPGQGAASDE